MEKEDEEEGSTFNVLDVSLLLSIKDESDDEDGDDPIIFLLSLSTLSMGVSVAIVVVTLVSFLCDHFATSTLLSTL